MIEGYLVAVVDDDESVRQAVAGLLRSAGAQVVSFASADAFLAKPFAADALLAAVDLATDDRLLAPGLRPRARG